MFDAGDVSDYAALAAKLTDITDYRIYCLLSGCRYDNAALKALRRDIVASIRKGGGVSLVDIAAKAAAIPGFIHFESAEIKMSRALERLMLREGREPLPGGITKLMCAVTVSGVYKQFLLKKFGFVSPPDNNLRLEQASEYLGLDENKLAGKRFDDWSERRIEESMYAVAGCRASLLAEICYNQLALGKAMERVKRQLPMCGYREFHAVTPGDLRLALALSCDFGWAQNGGLYSLMKSLGALDGMLQ